MLDLTCAQVRTLVVRAQGLHAPDTSRRTPSEVLDALGCIQIDTINLVRRSSWSCSPVEHLPTRLARSPLIGTRRPSSNTGPPPPPSRRSACGLCSPSAAVASPPEAGNVPPWTSTPLHVGAAGQPALAAPAADPADLVVGVVEERLQLLPGEGDRAQGNVSACRTKARTTFSRPSIVENARFRASCWLRQPSSIAVNTCSSGRSSDRSLTRCSPTAPGASLFPATNDYPPPPTSDKESFIRENMGTAPW